MVYMINPWHTMGICASPPLFTSIHPSKYKKNKMISICKIINQIIKKLIESNKKLNKIIKKKTIKKGVEKRC